MIITILDGYCSVQIEYFNRASQASQIIYVKFGRGHSNYTRIIKN